MQFADHHKNQTVEDYLIVELDQIKIMGRGIAGVESVYSIPQWNVTFDTGRAPQFSVHNSHLALSHWHMDHAGSLGSYLGLRCLNNLPPLNLVLPDQTVELAKEYLAALTKISESQINYKIFPASEPQLLKRHVDLIGIGTKHCLPCTGYGVVTEKKNLKNEYRGLSGSEIVDLKNKKIQVEDHVKELSFAYSGDSTAAFFETEAVKARILLMECTFFGAQDDRKNLEMYGHTHIEDWVCHAERIESETVIMTHTSQRYSLKEVETICLKKLPKSLTDRLIIFR